MESYFLKYQILLNESKGLYQETSEFKKNIEYLKNDEPIQ